MFGIPEEIISGNASHLTAKVYQELVGKYGLSSPQAALHIQQVMSSQKDKENIKNHLNKYMEEGSDPHQFPCNLELPSLTA